MAGGKGILRRLLGGRRAAVRSAPNPTDTADRSSLVVDHAEGARLIRSSYEDPPGMGRLDWRSVKNAPNVVTILIGARAAVSSELWPCLGTLLDGLVDEGCRAVRLTLADAATTTPGEEPLGQRIADSWGVEVFAASGEVVLVSDGSLFARTPLAGAGIWARFSPDTPPVVLGPRHPPPSWQEALDRLTSHPGFGCVAHAVPAGLLLRSKLDPPPSVDELVYAIPPNEKSPLLLLGRISGHSVPAQPAAELLAALPADIREATWLGPGARPDVLPLAQEVADLLGSSTIALTGVPLISEGSRSQGRVRMTLTGPDGGPTWRPLLQAVHCSPLDPASGRRPMPQPLGVRSPMPEQALAGAAHITLSERWRLTLTRGGIVLEEANGPMAPPVAQPVNPGRIAFDIRFRGSRSDASLLWACEQVLSGLDPAFRSWTELRVTADADDPLVDLRRIAIRHKVSFVALRSSATLPPQHAGASAAPLRSSGASLDGAVTPAREVAAPPAPAPGPSGEPEKEPEAKGRRRPHEKPRQETSKEPPEKTAEQSPESPSEGPRRAEAVASAAGAAAPRSRAPWAAAD